MEGLKIEYYTPHYDPMGDHLLEISSWNENYGDDKDTITELFMNKIEATDVDKDVIIGLLNTKVALRDPSILVIKFSHISVTA